MSINRLILQNLRANLRNYYLYVFALTFSVALYFAFVTLQYDPAMNEVEGSIKGAAAIRAASVLLIVIVAVFNQYANQIFVKRRSKEMGLLQLIGLTRNQIFRILGIENAALYFGALIVGSCGGFAISKLVLMLLFRITEVQDVAVLRFSGQALLQTTMVFMGIFLFICLLNYWFIRRQTILSLFRVTSSTETKARRMSIAELIIGLFGIILILTGYYVSSRLFSGEFKTVYQLFGAMIFILGSVILGTYLFFRGSVQLLLNLVRKRMKGYLTIRSVLSLSSIMFRMKSNSKLLTNITTVSALSIGLLSLSYISYYSAEQMAVNNIPAHFTMTELTDASRFTEALSQEGIGFTKTEIEVLQIKADLKEITPTEQIMFSGERAGDTILPVISDKYTTYDVQEGHTIFTGYSDIAQRFMPLKPPGQVVIKGAQMAHPLTFTELKRPYLVSWYFTAGGVPISVVDDKLYEELRADADPSIQMDSSLYIGIDIEDPTQLQAAKEVFYRLGYSDSRSTGSQQDMTIKQKQTMGLAMFIVGFLGLTFLITSGCILYFKQMEESEEEQINYTILRKLGFTQRDLLRGIQVKQLFNFGIPLVLGLFHSYFAVQSGWFLFGTEIWAPMIAVMVLYTALYSIFGFLSVLHYRKVIRRSLG